MIFIKLPDLVFDKSIMQSPSGRQQIRDCCQAAMEELTRTPTIRMFSCDQQNDILLLLGALDEIERIVGLADQLRAANTNLMAYERDHAAMEAIRRLEGELTTTEDTEGRMFWMADIGTWGQAEASDPADAVIAAYKIELEHMKTDPVKMEHRE